MLALASDQINTLWGIIGVGFLAVGCLGFCLVGGLMYLIYKFAYKASKQTPPETNNGQNSGDS